MPDIHIPVLLNESCNYLITNKSGVYFDGTLGFGGHSKFFLNSLDCSAIVIGTDVDVDAFSHCVELFASDSRVRLYNFNFNMIDTIKKIESIAGFDGIFVDLGVSSFQLDNSESGFTYRTEAILDLRMNKLIKLTAAEILNTFEQNEIAKIFFKYGEERNSNRIAFKIVEKRKTKPFRYTTDLSQLIMEMTPPNFHFKTLSRVFQALRIYINDELEVLRTFLTASVNLLNKGGRLVVLTYHSLEDRIVKEVFRIEAQSCICPPDFPICVCNKTASAKLLTKKGVMPSNEEIQQNNRSRSAKLRAIEKL